MTQYADGANQALCNGPGCESVYTKINFSATDERRLFCSDRCQNYYNARKSWGRPQGRRGLPDFGGASCSPAIAEEFFGNHSESGYVKRICAACPVRKACLHYAMQYNVEGVWGGTSQAWRERKRKQLGITPMEVTGFADWQLPCPRCGEMTCECGSKAPLAPL